MPSIDVNGFRSSYVRSGRGQPLVLLHGILCEHPFFRYQLEGLSSDFDVIVPELLGCGDSDDPPESYRFADYAQWLAGFIEALGLPAAHVGGVSWGGILSLKLAQVRPDLVRSLILADTYAGWKGSLPPEMVEERLQQCLRESEMDGLDFAPSWIPGLVTPDAPQTLRDEIAGSFSRFHPVGYRTMARSVAEEDLRSFLPDISVPALLLWGENDLRSPLSVAYAFHDAIPNASLAVIAGGSHLSNLEFPDEFNAAIRSFLNEQT